MTTEIVGNERVEAPDGAPTLLSFDQAQSLCQQGWLRIEVPQDLLDEIRNVSAHASNFFDRSSDEKLDLYPSGEGTEKGFYHVPDEKEYLTVRHHVHAGTPLEDSIRRVWARAATLLHRVLCDLSRAGYFDVNVWDAMLRNSLDLPPDASQVEDAISLMRLFRYYPGQGFAAEHVDIGLLTLCVGDGLGLQVLDRLAEPAPRWVDAGGPIILVGDMVRGLFNNRVRAGIHRVVRNPKGRSSLVFALRPFLQGDIDLSRFGGAGTVSTREYFLKIKASKYNINATKDIREKQKQEQKDLRAQNQAKSVSTTA